MKAPRCFISAGEYSGDLLAADLVVELRQHFPKLGFFGLTGPRMAVAGVKSVALIEEVNVLGFIEVLQQIGGLLAAEQRILTAIDRDPPDLAILVDFPGFHFRLAEQLRLRGIPVVQYVAPKVWAWGEHRVNWLRRDFALVLGILPFEEGFFLKHHVNYKYIGTPILDRADRVAVKPENLGLPRDRPIICMLPGSRSGEVKMIMPRLARLAKLLCEQLNAEIVVPVAETLAIEDVLRYVLDPNPQICVDSAVGGRLAVAGGMTFYRGMSLELMAVADAAVVTSGTATLECALVNTPQIVVYQMSELSYMVAKAKLHVPWVSLVNLIANTEIVPEYIQNVFPDALAPEVCALVRDNRKRMAMRAGFAAMRQKLTGNAARHAAQAIAALGLWT